MQENLLHLLSRIYKKLSIFILYSLRINAWKYRDLAVSKNVSLVVLGTLIYKKKCGINFGTNITIPKDASLTLGEGCYIGRNVEICPAYEIKIGSDTSIQDRCTILGEVTIGEHCLFGSNVYVSSGQHYFDIHPTWLIRDQDSYAANNKEFHLQNKAVYIEDDCWIGTNSVILAGVSIGKGAVIGANSVVTANVTPYTIVAGVPAKVLRKRHNYLPPLRIVFSNELHWPYFYSGFQISQHEISNNFKFDGLLASGDFSLSLDASNANHLVLIIKKINHTNCCLIWENNQYSVLETFQKVILPISETVRHAHKLKIKQKMPHSTIILKEAWVE